MAMVRFRRKETALCLNRMAPPVESEVDADADEEGRRRVMINEGDGIPPPSRPKDPQLLLELKDP